MGFYRAHVVGFPDRQRELRDLGFVWERLQPEYNLVVEALAAFRDVFGHLLVPSAFVVPAGDPAWPPGTAGLPLGRRARQIRRRLDHVAGDERRCRQLDELGFVWDPARHRRDLLHEAAARHAALAAGAAAPFDDGPTPPPAPADVDWAAFAVPARFAAPRDGEAGAADWPRRLRGFRLGARLADARRGAAPRDGAFEAFAAALGAYVALEGDADVPQKFVVPDSGGPWPPATRGLRLGARVAAVRSKGTYVGGRRGAGDVAGLSPAARARRARLDDLGFLWAKRGAARPRARRAPPESSETARP